jgi:GGDEF domain-containing protein
MLSRARGQYPPTATVFIDVDGIKHITDTFGHAAGDHFLQIIAARLSSVVGETQHCRTTRWGRVRRARGGRDLVRRPELVAERLLAVLRQPFVAKASQKRDGEKLADLAGEAVLPPLDGPSPTPCRPGLSVTCGRFAPALGSSMSGS